MLHQKTPRTTVFTSFLIFLNAQNYFTTPPPLSSSFFAGWSDSGNLRQAHARLIISGSAHNHNYLHLHTKLVAAYFQLGHVDDAARIFRDIPNPDSFSWKVLLEGFSKNHHFTQLHNAYATLRRSSIHNLGHDHTGNHANCILSLVVKGCVELRSLHGGKQVHCQIVKSGGGDDVVLSGLVDLYGKLGDLGDARQVFDEMSPQKRDVVPWTALIWGFVYRGHAEEAVILFTRMLAESVSPNEFTLVTVLSACAKLNLFDHGRSFHCYSIKKGLCGNSCLATALLAFYAKCGTIADAERVFGRELRDVDDVMSWTAMIVGYSQSFLAEKALEVFVRMRRCKVEVPNSVVMSSVLSACGQLDAVRNGMSVHGLVILIGLAEEVRVRNSLIDMYAKCGSFENALCLFESMGNKDHVSWNAIICGFSHGGFQTDALSIFRRMRLTNDVIQPDGVTLVGVLSACASLGAMQMGCSCHGYVLKVALMANVHIGTTLVHFYAKCGSKDLSQKVFHEMRNKNVATWNAVVSCYGMHGDAEKSLAVFSEMLKDNIRPNHAVYTSLLAACSHAGMVKEGQRCFDRMSRDHEIVPSRKHYGCMVDLLGRAGRLGEAMEFINRIPCGPNAEILGTLLHACKIHSNMDLGDKVLREMLRLQPDNGYYALASNMYAGGGRWEHVAVVRDWMKRQGFRKSPGSSIIEGINPMLRVTGEKRLEIAC